MMTYAELMNELRALRERCKNLEDREADLRRQVLNWRLEITDMVNGHNLAMSAVLEELRALAKRMNPKE